MTIKVSSDIIIILPGLHGSFKLFQIKDTPLSPAGIYKDTGTLIKALNSNYLTTPILILSPALFSKETILITSDKIKNEIQYILKDTPSKIVTATEYIDCTGKIVAPLTEPNINKVLKKVFKEPPGTVFVHLLNGIKNPVHEKMFMNVFSVAGYKAVLSSDIINIQ